MQIYSGHANGTRLERYKELGIGIMLHSCPTKYPKKDVAGMRCALDNGAYSCWRRGFPFMAGIFRTALERAYASGISLDFIVCPDIVCGGIDSLQFSMEWANGELKTAQNLALAVQDGISLKDLSKYHLSRFSTIFIGGSPEWKWKTASEWLKLSRDNGLRCHIGRAGTLHKMARAKELGVDSVDGTTFARAENFDVLNELENLLC